MSEFDNTKVDSSNLSLVWQRIAELIQMITGNVNISDDGTLQEQIIDIVTGNITVGNTTKLNGLTVDKFAPAVGTVKVDNEGDSEFTNDIVPVEADTLGGYEPSYFAPAEGSIYFDTESVSSDTSSDQTNSTVKILPLNADLLEGHNSEYFATKEDLLTKLDLYKIPNVHGVSEYRPFARIKQSIFSDFARCTVLLSNFNDVVGETGLYCVSASFYRQKISMSIVSLFDNKAINPIKFGYYTDDEYVYFCVYAYNYADNRQVIDIGHHTSFEVGVFDSVATQPDTWTDVDYNLVVQHESNVIHNAGYHNSTYRGKYLGSTVTNKQYEAISTGTFEDLYIGDYWIINNVIYRIAAFDYYYNTGDVTCTKHHVTIVPDNSMYVAQMKNTDSGDYEEGEEFNSTAGGYVGSDMYTTNLEQAKTIIREAFGENHILSHRQRLSNEVKDGYTCGQDWYDSEVELMTEQNVYGCSIFSNFLNATGHSYNYTIDKSQYPLFIMNPSLQTNRQTYWLRDIATPVYFCIVNNDGTCCCYDSSRVYGVRPAFSIC